MLLKPKPDLHGTSATGASIELAGLTKRYAGATAVDALSLRVEAGEFVALLGPSGCGKSTVLKCIAGFEHVDAGSIRVGDRAIDQVPADRRDIGMVFQSYALFPHMTVTQNVAFPLRMRGIGRSEQHRRVEETLLAVGLEGLGARFPGQLSGGQQQRVALARSIVYRPPVLLLDEPLSALDKKLRERMQIELKQLQRTLGVTVVFVTHDQHEALTMADRIAVMRDGELEQVGTARELYDRPGTEFVAEFIGDSNCLPGRVKQVTADDAIVVAVDGQAMPGTFVDDGTPAEGASVSIRVRPEHVTIEAGDASGLAGTVRDIVFEGFTTAVTVETDSGHFVRSRAPAGAFGGLSPGDAVSVSWQPGAALAFKA